MTNQQKTMLVVVIQGHLADAQKSFDRAVQCSDVKGAHQEAAYEFGRVEASAKSIQQIVRCLIGSCDLENGQ